VLFISEQLYGHGRHRDEVFLDMPGDASILKSSDISDIKLIKTDTPGDQRAS
jgi:hypothetical protein